MLFDLVRKSGSTDYTDALAVTTLRADVENIFELLESHAHNEDAHIMPLVRAAFPKLAAEYDEAHGDQEARIAGLLAALHRLDPAAPDAAALGHRITLQLSRIAGELLTHMADEELELNPVLWNAYEDAELHEAEQKIVTSIPPEKMGRYLRWMIPAMNPRERAEFAAVLPPPAREFVESLMKEVVTA